MTTAKQNHRGKSPRLFAIISRTTMRNRCMNAFKYVRQINAEKNRCVNDFVAIAFVARRISNIIQKKEMRGERRK